MNFFSDKVCQPGHSFQYFLSTICSWLKEKPVPASHAIPISDHYSFRIFQQVEDLPSDFEERLTKSNVFLQSPFLAALQRTPPEGLRNRYMLMYQDGRPVGIILLQLIDYRLKESLKDLAEGQAKDWSHQLRLRAASVLNFRLLVIGNLLLSGEHGYAFDEGCLSKKEGVQLLLEAMPLVKRELEKAEGHRLSGVLLKDMETPLTSEQQRGLMHQVTFQPVMQLRLGSDWDNMEAYLAALQSKYRVRAKRAFKKAKGIQIRELELEEIGAKQEILYQLYQAVADKATFNMLSLGKGYFRSLKQELGEKFRIFGYEDEHGELIGFCTLIQNGSEYDAHFLGLDDTANRARQLYLNMLFDMLGQAIDNPAIEHITFGRTALEIKSSIGAKPRAMYCYIKHFNPVFNLIIGWLVRKYDPVEEWQPRHPFKTKATAEA